MALDAEDLKIYLKAAFLAGSYATDGAQLIDACRAISKMADYLNSHLETGGEIHITLVALANPQSI